jgi:hypothetical protein
MMYSGTMTVGQLIDQIQAKGANLLDTIRQAKLLYDKWYQTVYGLTDEQILALPQFSNMTAADLTKIKYGLGALNDVASGNALAPATRDAYLVPFL